MDVLPLLQQERLAAGHKTHGAADLAARHAVGPDERRSAIGPEQVYLGLPVTEDVDMRRLMIVKIDNDAQAIGTQHGDYAAK